VSLTARLAAMIVVALFATQLVNGALWLVEGEPLPPGPPLPERMAVIAQLLEAAPPADRPALLTALSRRPLVVAIAPGPTFAPGPASDHRHEMVRRRIQAALGDAARPILVGPPPGLHVELPLADGAWLALSAAGGLPPLASSRLATSERGKSFSRSVEWPHVRSVHRVFSTASARCTRPKSPAATNAEPKD